MSRRNKGITVVAVIAIIFIIIMLVILALALKDDFSSNPTGSLVMNSEYYDYQLSDGSHATITTKDFNILMSSENKELESLILSGNYSKNYHINVDYADTFEALNILNNGTKYDALFISNSIWQYKLNSNVSLKNAKSTSITPIAFGIKKSKAESLGFTKDKVYTKDIIDAVKDGKLKFTMSNPTTTNSGASAYFALLYTLADYPVVLTEEHLQDEKIQSQIKDFFMGQERTVGDENFLGEAFLKGDYEAVVSYEYSIIDINKQLESQGKEPLYIVYPYDGVAICDNIFGYLDNKDDNKLEMFLEIQDYLLSSEAKEKLASLGRRTWYGGITTNADKNTFNPSWGIDTTKYINSVKFPSKDVISLALAVYQEQFRKPVHVVFCLDFSGSMQGNGYEELKKAMEYILTDEASAEYIQFASSDYIDIVPFESKIHNVISTKDGTQTAALLNDIRTRSPYGGTALYEAAATALKILKDENQDERNRTIILMTDGEGNIGSFNSLRRTYEEIGEDIPIYSIMFGDASDKQLNEIAELTNAKVFDGKNDLVKAFKEVRGYN